LDVTLKGEPKRLLERQKIPAAADGEKESFEEDCLAHHAWAFDWGENLKFRAQKSLQAPFAEKTNS
jgi:hypothetical protein